MNITKSEVFKFSTLFQSIQAHKKPEEKKRQLSAWIETIEKQLAGGVLSSLLICEMLELVLILGTLYYCTFMERPMTT